MLGKIVFSILRVTFLVVFWSRGTDETFLDICGKDKIFCTVRRFFQKNYFGQMVPLHSTTRSAHKKCFANLECLFLGVLAE